MRRAAILLVLTGSPAVAAQPYVGFEIGSEKVRPSDIDETVTFSSTPAAPGDPNTVFYDDVFSARYKKGRDVGLTGGFDFGWFRIEGELAQKRIKIDQYKPDDITDQFLTELNGALNRPSAAPDPGAPGSGALALDDFQPSATLKVRSAIVNALIDVKLFNRFNAYGGAGFGKAFIRGFDDSDSEFVWQRVFGARYGITDRFDVGVKYRNFRTGVIKLNHDPVSFSGNPDQTNAGVVTTNASVVPDLEGQFRAKSVLLTLNYNLR